MIKFAIVGCGRIAVRHASLLVDEKIEGGKLIAVCDVNEQRAKSFSEKFKVPFYTKIASLLSSEEVDVCLVLTPSGCHAQNVIEVAAHGKHVVVEKPMALKIEDADLMISACDDAKVNLYVVKQNRWNLPVVKLREALESGRFGKIFLGSVRVRWCRTQDYYDQDSWRGTWALDGGVLANQASHHIDLLTWMLGRPMTVFAKSISALANIEAEDTAVVIVKFESGALGVIEATTASRPKDLEGSLSVMGEFGSVEISGFAVNRIKTWNFVEDFDGEDSIKEKTAQNPENVYGFGHQAYLQHVVDTIISGDKPLIDGREGKKSLELICSIYESIATGKEIFVGDAIKHSKLGKTA